MKKMRSNFAGTIAFVSTILVFPANASADMHGQITGAGCVPKSDAIQRDLYFTGGFGVSFKSGKLGTIILNCPIAPIRLTGDYDLINLKLYYKDPDGMDIAYRVRAYLKTARFGSPISTVACTADSNTKSSRSYTSVDCNPSSGSDLPGVHTWVEVLIDRNSGTLNPEFLGLSYTTLDGGVCGGPFC